MNIYQLRYLKGIVENSSYSVAAEQLFVTQSTLVIAIKKLEDELGVSLLCKQGKITVLTPAGAHIYPLACKAISSIDQIYSSVDDYFKTFTFEVRIGIPTLANADDLLLAIRDYFMAPDSNIRIMFDQFAGPDGLEIKLDNGELDLAVLIKPISKPAIEYINYRHEEYNLILPIDHPLAAYEKITPEFLSSESLLLIDWKKNRGVTKNILSYLIQNGVSSDTYASSSLDYLISTPTLLHLVQRKDGLAILSESTLLPEGLVKRPLTPPLLIETVIAWNADAYKPKAQKKVLDFILEHIKTCK